MHLIIKHDIDNYQFNSKCRGFNYFDGTCQLLKKLGGKPLAMKQKFEEEKGPFAGKCDKN